MKKNISKFLFALLIAVLVFALVACNPTDDTDPDNNGKDPETANYTVTFDSDGGARFDSYNTTVESGSKVTKPGSDPYKTGYTFLYWTLNGGDQFNFDTQTITSNTIIKAAYSANKYSHRIHLYEDKDAETYQGHVSFPDTVEEKLETVYNDSANAVLPIPKTTFKEYAADADPMVDEATIDDYFVYWYYYNDAGEQIQLTKWADTSTTKLSLVTKYTLPKVLDVYAMWHSSLPEYKVSFWQEEDEKGVFGDYFVKKNDHLILPDDVASQVESGNIYKSLNYWYYLVTNDDETVTEKKFEFASTAEGADNTSATKIEKDMILYGNWSKRINVGKIGDGAPEETPNYTTLADLAAEFKNANAEKKAELCSAHIYINEDFTVGDWTALFGDENVFTGKIIGNGHTITINSFADGKYWSFIGASSGSISDLKVVVPSITKAFAATDNVSLYIGGIVGSNSGTINNCHATVTLDISNQGKEIFYVGGIAAFNSAKGEIYNSSSDLNVKIDGALSAQVGGLVGASTGGTISKNTAKTIVSLDNIVKEAAAGGLVGKAKNGTISECAVEEGSKIEVSAVENADAGGFVGKTDAAFVSKCYMGKIEVISATANIAYAGGAVGYHEGLLQNCRIDVDNVTANSTGLDVYAKAAAGGIAGGAGSQGGAFGKISACYAEANVSATAEGKATAYVGGALGENIRASIDKILVSGTVSATQADTELAPHVGYAVGYIGTSTSFSAIYHNISSVTFNGALYNGDSENPNFVLTAPSTGTIVATDTDILDSAFITGSSKLGFNSDIWRAGDGKKPALKIEPVASEPDDGGDSGEPEPGGDGE